MGPVMRVNTLTPQGEQSSPSTSSGCPTTRLTDSNVTQQDARCPPRRRPKGYQRHHPRHPLWAGGATRPPVTDPTRHSTTASCAGAGPRSSTASFRPWPQKAPPPRRSGSIAPIGGRIAPPPACSRGGFSTPDQTHPGWAELEAPRRLRWQARRAAVDGGADTVLDALPEADVLIADKGYDSDRLREALVKRGIKSCIPGRANRKEPIIYDRELYKSRNLIERLFGRLKDWRRIAT